MSRAGIGVGTVFADFILGYLSREQGEEAMSSARKIEANRRNALHSTGPRTASGKSKVGKNPTKHGLAASIRQDPVPCSRMEALARVLCPHAVGEQREKARRFIEAELDVLRVQDARARLVRLHERSY